MKFWLLDSVDIQVEELKTVCEGQEFANSKLMYSRLIGQFEILTKIALKPFSLNVTFSSQHHFWHHLKVMPIL